MDLHPSILQRALFIGGYGILLLDANAHVVFWNDWLVRHSGIPEERAIGQHFQQLFPAENLGPLLEIVDDALQNAHDPAPAPAQNPFLLPLYAQAESNREQRLPHSIAVRPLRGSDNRNFCLIEIGDLQSTYRREQVLRKQHQDLTHLAERQERLELNTRAIIENIGDALISLDSGDRVVELNGAAQKLFRLCDENILGKDACQLFDDFCTIKQAHQGQSIRGIFGLLGNGRRFPAEVKVTMVGTDGPVARMLIVRDLSDRREAEERLFREQEFAQITLQSIKEAVITTDERGNISSANKAACQLLRKDRDRVIDRPLLDLLAFTGIDCRRAARQGLSQVLEGGEAFELPGLAELRFDDGETIFVNGRFNVLHGGSGESIGSVVVLQDITVEKRMQEILSYQATHDELTSLINRREFERQLCELLDKRGPLNDNILLYLDLDQFKLINDNCGHDAGDLMLRQLTGLLRTRLRHTDLLARLGGDEFAALLPNCSVEIGHRIAEEMRETVRDFRFSWGGRNFAVGVSIGMVQIDQGMDNAASVMSAADSACYIAKENGRDQVVLYKVDGNEEQRRRDEMSQAAHIREALEHNRFTLFCQPIVPVDPHKEKHWSIEVLIRMLGEDGKTVAPMTFIPAAERYNLMSHIDRWVVDAVCEHWRQSPTLFERLDRVAVNLSGQSVANDEFLRYVIEQVESCGLPWNKLCFEITETAAVASIEKAQHFMRQLSAKGCRFALDDFGSGLSSFAYLKHLPVDFLKIDGAFVKDMLVDNIDAAMVRSISDIGHSMGLKTIAEFVENQEIVEALRQAKVNFAQGWGICKPMPLAELPNFSPSGHSASKRALHSV